MNSDSSRTFFVIVLVIACCGLPISFAQLIVGGHYFTQCPANQQKPTFLVVSGVLGLILEIATMVCFYLYHTNKHGDVSTIGTSVICTILFLFFFIWYIYGGTLVDLSYTEASAGTCAMTLQTTINGTVILYWIPYALVIAMIIFIFTCAGKKCQKVRIINGKEYPVD